MLTDIKTALRPAIILTLVFAVLLGLIYPLALTGLGQALFPDQANGSLVRQDGRVIGSELIGQKFTGEAYFHGRPSAAGADGYDASASAGSNLGPASKALAERVQSDMKGLSASGQKRAVPVDLVTTSGSGLDPDISPEAAFYQVDRVAKTRNLSNDQVRDLVKSEQKAPLFGFLGEPRVNVLSLNRALDRMAPLR